MQQQLQVNAEMNYADFFKKATGCQPYPFQQRLAQEPWPDLLRVPTGSGKTRAVILSWLWRVLQKTSPTRLVYCLPMRVLVRQTLDEAQSLVDKLAMDVQVHPLMGGFLELDWDRHPERPTILVGTLDQLLSRALNRGYAMSRFRWPNHFGLLHNDVQWIFDEVQLMGVGSTTSAQLHGLREALGHFGQAHSMWMSATLNPTWLMTVDRPTASEPQMLSSADLAFPELRQRLYAPKQVARAEFLLNQSSKDKAPRWMTERLLQQHRPGTVSLVVVNQVDRAVAVYQALLKAKLKAETLLLHSRFRPYEREPMELRLKEPVPPEGRIVVSTQVVEAGVDLSSAYLLTELAPWASMVQRFGRCNRFGELDQARIEWVDVDSSATQLVFPYTPEQLDQARERLSSLTEACPANLPPEDSEQGEHATIRRRDLIELFDTTPDLAGEDIDVSRYIRVSEKPVVQVFWREIPPGQSPPPELAQPRREELCPVTVERLRDVLKRTDGYRWDPLEKQWAKLGRNKGLFEGVVVLLPSSAGAYSEELGWTSSSVASVPAVPPGPAPPELPEPMDEDPTSTHDYILTLLQHTENVVTELESILGRLGFEVPRETLINSAWWHDVGKAHPEFQKTMRRGFTSEFVPAPSELYAKTAGKVRHERKGLRHELASALVAAQCKRPDLEVYLVAAHHGKVRVSVRKMPNEPQGQIRGIRESDVIEAAQLGPIAWPQTQLRLDCFQIGEDSWTQKVANLTDELGPLRLAYLEALLRAADTRASEKERTCGLD